MNVHASGAHTATMRAGAQRWTDGLTLTAIFTGATPHESVTCVCSTDLIPMPPERGWPPVDEFIIDMHGGGGVLHTWLGTDCSLFAFRELTVLSVRL